MRSTVKYLICFCLLLSGVVTLTGYYAHGESELHQPTHCSNLIVLNARRQDDVSFCRDFWIGREKTALYHRGSIPERRENEEDDESHTPGSRLGAACISSIFFGLASEDVLSRIHVAFCRDAELTHSSRYLVLQVFRI